MSCKKMISFGPRRDRRDVRRERTALFGGLEADTVVRVTRTVRVAVVLQTGGAQAADAMAVDQALPGDELFHRKLIALAGFF